MAGSMRHQGNAMRDRAVSLAMKRKEEYLGARVPKELRDRVTARAKELGIPVSILIRNILEESFRENSAAAMGVTPAAERAPASSDKFATVLGWKRIVLNKNVACAGCGTALQAGKEVTFGLGGVEPIVLCDRCKDRI